MSVFSTTVISLPYWPPTVAAQYGSVELICAAMLDFDIEFQGLQAFESKRWPWIDWAYINAYDESGNLLQHPLISMATGPSGRTGASGTFTLNAGTPTSTDRVTLWYQNRAFDYSVSSGSGGGSSCVQAIWSQSASPSCEQDIFWQSASASTDQAMWWQGNANYTHYVQIQTQAHGWNHIYGVQEDGLNSAQIAQNSDPCFGNARRRIHKGGITIGGAIYGTGNLQARRAGKTRDEAGMGPG